VGDGGSNTLSGAAGADELIGNGGNDVLDGGTGGDVMSGGGGNDVYVVDSSLDSVLEGVAGGSDIVRTALTKYSLSNLSNVENLHYTGASRASLIGNHLGNHLLGGPSHDILDGASGADRLLGGLGNDTYVVDNAGDVVSEGTTGGRDTVQASVSYTLSPNVENLTLMGVAAIDGLGNDLANTLTGNSAANTLYGHAGNDRLYGGAGADAMHGGSGNDSYQVDDAGDAITEKPGEGTDTVSSSITYSLAANLEKLTLSGSGAISGSGNASANTLTGNAAPNTLQGLGGNDTLSGLAGDDRLDGGVGNDVLRGGNGADQLLGGAGADRFDWDNSGESGPGSLRDTVLDFAQGADKLDFSGVDAISSTAQDDKFSFIGGGEFTGVAGQLRYASDGAGTLIQGDVNGDAIADLEIYLAGQLTMLFSSDIMV
jgi:Ca2+-binding RTX toxin-like protein